MMHSHVALGLTLPAVELVCGPGGFPSLGGGGPWNPLCLGGGGGCLCLSLCGGTSLRLFFTWDRGFPNIQLGTPRGIFFSLM